MLRSRIGFACVATIAALGAGAPATAQDQPQQPLTERRETMQSAVETPAEDLNLKQTPIPEVLQRAVINPYDMRTLEACRAVAAEVQRLDAALGADRDEPPEPDTRTVQEKREGGAAAALKLGIEAVTPYRGVIRWATGATAYARTVQEAIEAGFARRGFLKGMAVKMNCAPPASPAWFRPASGGAPTPHPVYSVAPDYRGYPPSHQAYSTARADTYAEDVAPATPYGPPAYQDRHDEDRYDEDRYGGDYRSYRGYPEDRADPPYRSYRDDRYDDDR